MSKFKAIKDTITTKKTKKDYNIYIQWNVRILYKSHNMKGCMQWNSWFFYYWLDFTFLPLPTHIYNIKEYRKYTRKGLCILLYTFFRYNDLFVHSQRKPEKHLVSNPLAIKHCEDLQIAKLYKKVYCNILLLPFMLFIRLTFLDCMSHSWLMHNLFW